MIITNLGKNFKFFRKFKIFPKLPNQNDNDLKKCLEP